MDNKENTNSIFREKSMDKVSSPEALNDYIRVTTPSVWVVLIALVLLLVGMITWSIFGRVTVHGEDGTEKQVAPISFIIN